MAVMFGRASCSLRTMQCAQMVFASVLKRTIIPALSRLRFFGVSSFGTGIFVTCVGSHMSHACTFTRF